MSQDERERVQRLQARINELLREKPGNGPRSHFSAYLPGPTPQLVERLNQAAAQEGTAGVEAALAEYERLLGQEDPDRMRYVLMLFLTDNPLVARLGLRIPSLLERSPWSVLPSHTES